MYNQFDSHDYAIIEDYSGNDHEVPELDHWVLEEFDDLVPEHVR